MNHTSDLLDLDAQATMRGRLASVAHIKAFVEAGNATLTIASRGSGQRFTFKFSRAKDKVDDANAPVFVSLMSGSDNESDYSFVGTLFPPNLGALRFSRASRVASTAPSVKALTWMLFHLYGGGIPDQVLRQAEVWHEGRCGRCGRKLTVPSSIESGFGPDCASQMQH